MRFGSGVLGVITAAAIIAPAAAQVPVKGNSGGSGGAASTAAGADAVVIGGVAFEVRMIARDPATDGYRLIVQLMPPDGDRKTAFVKPQAKLIDDFGNVYVATASSGVMICGWNSVWDEEPRNCVGRSAGDLTQLNPGIPVTVSISFVPDENGVIPDTVSMASTATLNARLIMTEDRKFQTMDIQIPQISLPN